MRHKLTIRQPLANDSRLLTEMVNKSVSLHRPWVFAPRTPKDFSIYLKRYQEPDQFSYLILTQEPQSQLVGVVNLSNIIWGNFANAFLGYYASIDFVGQGYMAEGMMMVIHEAFQKHNLHRLEANIQPENHNSIKLVKKLGFEKEGFSPEYLHIGGKWQDHERWAIRKSSQPRP